MIKPLAAWWGRRRARERALAIGGALVALALLVDTLAFAPQRAQADALRKQLTAARQQASQLRVLAEQHAAQGDAASRGKQAELAQRRTRAEAALADAQTGLMAPRDMLRQLEAMLAAHPRLRVIGIQTQAPQPLAADPGDAAAGLYQHGLELRVEGRYLDLLAWLQALERAPHRVYWRELELKVGTDGVPVTRVAVFTLSREATWLQL